MVTVAGLWANDNKGGKWVRKYPKELGEEMESEVHIWKLIFSFGSVSGSLHGPDKKNFR